MGEQNNSKDVIVTDEDTKDEDLYEHGVVYPYDMQKEVDIRDDRMSIFEWNRKLEQGKLKLDPEFQRNLVWRDEQKSNFIESILLNIPLPPFYVNQDKSGDYIIVDGLQRTSTISSFINNEFKLQGLDVLKELNDCSFKDLDISLKALIEDKQLQIYVIKPSVPMKMVYEIFNRINTGGTQLNRQEIRNCIYIGKATRLLNELSQKKYFKTAIGYGISSKRMKDKEVILRYLAFKIFDYKEDYKNDMDYFLVNAMKKMNSMEDSELDSLSKDFERVMKLTYNFFQNKNFRLPTENTRGRINIALLESICYFFSLKSDDFLNKNRETILSNYGQLLRNPKYIDSTRFSTGDKKRVIKRFELVQEMLGRE